MWIQSTWRFKSPAKAKLGGYLLLRGWKRRGNQQRKCKRNTEVGEEQRYATMLAPPGMLRKMRARQTVIRQIALNKSICGEPSLVSDWYVLSKWVWFLRKSLGLSWWDQRLRCMCWRREWPTNIKRPTTDRLGEIVTAGVMGGVNIIFIPKSFLS